MAIIKNGRVNIVLISGITLIIFSLGWSAYHLQLMYAYYFSEELFIIRIPDWVLLLNAGTGIIGILLGIGILKFRLQIGKAYLIAATIFTCARLLEFGMTV